MNDQLKRNIGLRVKAARTQRASHKLKSRKPTNIERGKITAIDDQQLNLLVKLGQVLREDKD